jgi:hypothetical protein
MKKPTQDMSKKVKLAVKMETIRLLDHQIFAGRGPITTTWASSCPCCTFAN